MDIKQIITATVAVILICLVAIPLIQTSSEGLYSTENNTSEKYLMASDGSGTTTIEFTSGGYIADGVTTPYDETTRWMVKVFWPGGFVKYNGTIGSMDLNKTGTDTRMNVSKIVYDSQADTLTYTTTTGDITISDVPYMYYMSDQGNYGFFKASEEDININKNVDFFIICEDTYKPNFGSFRAIYTYNNGEIKDTIFTPQFAEGQTYNFQNTTITFNLTIDDVDSRHYTITGFSDLNINDTAIDSNTVTLAIIAPIEYEYVSDNDSIIITILDLIPILLIAAVLIGIGYSIMRRD